MIGTFKNMHAVNQSWWRRSSVSESISKKFTRVFEMKLKKEMVWTIYIYLELM